MGACHCTVFLLWGTRIYLGFAAVTPLSCHRSLLAAGALMSLNCLSRARGEGCSGRKEEYSEKEEEKGYEGNKGEG